MKNKIISFPHLGDYAYIVKYLFIKLTDCEIMLSPKITKRTIELGNKNSPNFVCVPFKYNLGNYIEALENGANVLFQFGGGCRYGYYAELQEQILKDLGYNFTFYTMTDKGKLSIKKLYKIFKELNNNLKFSKFIYHFIITFLMIFIVDKREHFIRKNIGFEEKENSFINLKQNFIDELINNKGIINTLLIGKKYKKLFKNLGINKPTNPLKVGIIGELYTSMEPFSSYNLEYELAKLNIEIKRFTNLSYLLILKWIKRPYIKYKIRKFVKYELGADGLDNVYRTIYLMDKKYDGIIHIKPFGCTPEVSTIPIIDKICHKNNMPITYFSFDTLTENTGITTRIEAFYDMIKMKKEKEYE